MNLKPYILPVTLALITTLAIQYFFLNRWNKGANPDVVQSGQTFIAPESAVAAQPLNREVDFVEPEATSPQALETVVDTTGATYIFTSRGACLQELTFKRVVDGQLVTMDPLKAGASTVHGNFLVALAKKTPLSYSLVDNKRLNTAYQLTYRGETEQAVIEKVFVIYDDSFKIDLNLTIIPKNTKIQPRLLYRSPHMNQITNDVVSALYNNHKGAVQKENVASLDTHKGWFMPTLFGSENRYFVQALVADQSGFAQRAYFSVLGADQVISILEGAPITQRSQWNLSFYFGPKEDKAMAAVDPRLEQTLEYSGWLAPLSRLLLWILKYLYSFVHNYGWAIVLMTLLINLVLLPLNIRSAKSMKKYADFQKKLAYIQQRYKHDPEALARERTELVSKHGLSGMGGCLPKLLQLPIFFALNRVLSSSIELYKAPFLWMKDLSAKDPYYIFPLLIVGFMIAQATSGDPKQRFMVIGVALVFGAAAANFSAGLSLYIFIGVLLNGIQMFLQNKFNWA